MPRVADGNETVLLVEDEHDTRDLTRRLLEELGYRVLGAGDHDAALELYESVAEVELLVTDLVLPGKSGHELWCTLRSRDPDLAVLFMSGYSERVLSRHGLEPSALNVLQKPFSGAELAARIRAILDAPSPTGGAAGRPV